MDKVAALPGMGTLAKSQAFADKLTFNLINAGGRALTTAAITGGSVESAIKDALLGALVDTAHGEVASQIKAIEHEFIAHKLAHALAGCAAGAAAGGKCKDGAIGAAVGEIVAKLMPPENRMFYTPAEREKLLAYGKLIAGGIAAYSGGNAQTAITTAETALRNNALFVVPLVYALAAAAGYITGVGEGDPVEGLKVFGQGKDPLSQALAKGTEKAISLSMDRWPQETTATLNLLLAAGNAIDATVTYVDAATGKVVSTQWNKLPEDTRYTLIGAGKITSVMVSAVGVSAIKNLVLKGPNPVNEAKWLAAQQGRNSELRVLFNAAEPKNELTIGGRVYQATAESNKAGTTKVFDTSGLSNSRLDQEVWAYVKEVAGGRPFEAASKPGVWYSELPDGSKVTLRDLSKSQIGNSGKNARWTIDIDDNPALGGLKKKNEYEVKFK